MAKAKDRKQAGKEYLEGILAKLPEEVRTTVQTHLLSDELAAQVGDDVLRHDEFSRMSDALRTAQAGVDKYKTDLDAWYAERKGALEEYDRLKTGRVDDDDRPPAKVDLTGYVKAEDVEKAIRQTQEDGLWLIKTTNRLSLKHLREFGEDLDFDTVMDHARDKKLTLDLAYESLMKPRYDEKRQKDIDTKIVAAKEEGRLEEARRREQMPYPVDNKEPSTLDGLRPDFQKGNSVQQAVDDYYKSQRPA